MRVTRWGKRGVTTWVKAYAWGNDWEWVKAVRPCAEGVSEWGWGGKGVVTEGLWEWRWGSVGVTGWLRELKWGIELRERECPSEGEDWGREAWVLSCYWINEGLGLDYRHIYIGGIFVISGYRVFIRAGFRVKFQIFFIKPGPDPDPLRVFLKKKLILDPIPNLTR